LNRVFLDTVGLIALWDESDQWHAAAATAFQQIKTSSAILYSTTFVMLECGNAAARRPYRGAVDRLRKALETASCLLHPNEDEWKDAWGAYAADPVGGPGIVDHVHSSQCESWRYRKPLPTIATSGLPVFSRCSNNNYRGPSEINCTGIG
jgi:hypothetical protein